jgi:hypothetical protein
VANVYEDRPEIGRISAQFREDQLEAFLRIEPNLCGEPVVPFTPRIAAELQLAGNSFCAGGTHRAEDVLQFVHRIHRDFSKDNSRQVRDLAGRLSGKAPIPEIDQYLARANATSFGVGGRKEQEGAVPRSDSCWASILVDIFCSRYAWSIDEVLDTPFRILWQQMCRVVESKDPDFVQRAPKVMEIRQKYLEEIQAKLDAANAAKRGGRPSDGS